MPKKVWGYAKKRETHEALKIAIEKKKKGTHEGSKVLEKRKIKIAHTSKAIIKERESHDQRIKKYLELGITFKILHTCTS